jgi:hypothetical protein
MKEIKVLKKNGSFVKNVSMFMKSLFREKEYPDMGSYSILFPVYVLETLEKI